MSPRSRLSTALVAALAAACGKDAASPTAPNIPSVPSVVGQWSYSTTNISAGGITCSSGGTTLTITQQGTSFSGSYGGGTLTCSSSGGSQSLPIGTGIVLNGSVTGSAVAFDLDTSDWHNGGTINGNSMSGTAMIRVVVGGVPYTLTGTWGASRL